MSEFVAPAALEAPALKRKRPDVKAMLRGLLIAGIPALKTGIENLGVENVRVAFRTLIVDCEDAEQKQQLVALYAETYPSAPPPDRKGTFGATRDRLKVSTNDIIHFSGSPIGVKKGDFVNKRFIDDVGGGVPGILITKFVPSEIPSD